MRGGEKKRLKRGEKGKRIKLDQRTLELISHVDYMNVHSLLFSLSFSFSFRILQNFSFSFRIFQNFSFFIASFFLHHRKYPREDLLIKCVLSHRFLPSFLSLSLLLSLLHILTSSHPLPLFHFTRE